MPERNARKEVKTPGRTQLVLPREPVQTRSRTRTTDSKKSKKTLLDDDMGTGKNTLKEDVIVSTPCNMKTLQRCPTCFSVLPIVQGTDYQASPVAQCTNCPTKPYLCATCLSPWQGPPGVLGRCTNQRCAVVGTLLTCGLITDPSKVKGCPEFRACPKCYSLLTHSRGCNQLSRLNLKHQLSMDPGAKKCPTCSSVLRIIQGTHWQASPVAQCTICPTKPYLCATCLYPWQGPPGVLGRCTNKSLYQCPADFGRNQVMPKRNGRKEVKTHGSTQLVVPRDVPREPVETRSRTRTTAPKKRKKKQLDDGIAVSHLFLCPAHCPGNRLAGQSSGSVYQLPHQALPLCHLPLSLARPSWGAGPLCQQEVCSGGNPPHLWADHRPTKPSTGLSRVSRLSQMLQSTNARQQRLQQCHLHAVRPLFLLHLLELSRMLEFYFHFTEPSQ
ncbi:uncharacterized protein LOC134080126 isoform X2 [Sardina pilchardus]|uniref:uncharacterized protein LOC134080126 isoform X2 n=1 Tax=Sardina pilchardus TaxID=27697 RepID=UPI002E0DC15A